MNIEHVKLFVRIASTHNISVAGQELGLSPAVASAHINKLESGLGVRLIHRTTRKVSLTQEGEAFLAHAEAVLISVETAKASISSEKLLPTGTLRISAPSSFGRMHLIPTLQKFMALYPGLTIDCRLSDSINDLVEGGFDVAIRNAELQDSGLIAKKLCSDERIVCASPDYLIKHGRPSSPIDLLAHQFINLSGLDSWTFKTTDGNQTIKTKGHFKADNGEAVRDACVYGLGLTISSLWCVYEHIENKQLVQVLEDYPLISNTAIWAVYPSSRLLAPKIRVFIDFLSEHFSSPLYWNEK